MAVFSYSNSVCSIFSGEPSESEGGDLHHGGGDVSGRAAATREERGAGEEEHAGQLQVLSSAALVHVTISSLL